MDLLRKVKQVTPEKFYVYSKDGWHIVRRLPNGQKGKGPFISVKVAQEWIQQCEWPNRP